LDDQEFAGAWLTWGDIAGAIDSVARTLDAGAAEILARGGMPALKTLFEAADTAA
jgi:hypothetical protein